MSFEHPWLVTTLVLLFSACVLVQTALVVVLNRHVSKQVKNLTTAMQDLSGRTRSGMENLDRLMGSIREKTTVLPEIQRSMENQLQDFVKHVRQLDGVAGRQIDLLRYQLQQAGSAVDGAVTRVSQRTFKLHKATLHSPVGIATLFQIGLRMVLHLFSKPPGSPPSHASDIEDFI